MKSQPSQMNIPSYPPPVPPELQPPPGPPPFMSQNVYCYGNIFYFVVLYFNFLSDQPNQVHNQSTGPPGRGRGRGGRGGMEGRGRGRGNNNQRGGRGGGGGGKSWPANQNNTQSPQQRLGVNFGQTPTLGFNQPSQNQAQNQSFNNGQNNQQTNPNNMPNITQVKPKIKFQ